MTVQNKVTESETPQGTAQEHSLGYIDPFSYLHVPQGKDNPVLTRLTVFQYSEQYRENDTSPSTIHLHIYDN